MATSTTTARKTSTTAAKPQKLVVIGPLDGIEFHVHTATCGDKRKAMYKPFAAEWTVANAQEWTTLQEIVEYVYDGQLQDRDANFGPGATEWRDMAGEFKVQPCVKGLGDALPYTPEIAKMLGESTPVEATKAEAKATSKRSTKPKFEKGIATEKGCSASTDCAHTTYPTEDAHCRKPGCANFIDDCGVHIRPKAIAKRAEAAKKAAADKVAPVVAKAAAPAKTAAPAKAAAAPATGKVAAKKEQAKARIAGATSLVELESALQNAVQVVKGK